MIVFPNCKINLGLRVLNKRQDGYHDIETIFFPIPLKDALEVVDGNDQLIYTASGVPIAGNPENNLCIAAYHLLQKDFPQLPGIKIHLHKKIPMGAGLGGGSADAAFMLQLLNKQLGLQLSTSQLLAYALQLGSDCPFFILNTPCIGTGRGEQLQPVYLDLSSFYLLLVHPGIHVNTREAFGLLDAQGERSQLPLQEIVKQPVADWQHLLKNDFEQPVFEKYPLLKEIRESLYQQGASYSAMSGSGSTVYGLFEKHLSPATNFDPYFFVCGLSL